jgi:hypothetical protein
MLTNAAMAAAKATLPEVVHFIEVREEFEGAKNVAVFGAEGSSTPLFWQYVWAWERDGRPVSQRIELFRY